MPIYDLKCRKCGSRFTNYYCRSYHEEVKCSCGAVMERLPALVNPDCFPQDGIFLEHVSSKGKRFYSRKEMADFEKKTGTMIGCLH